MTPSPAVLAARTRAPACGQAQDRAAAAIQVLALTEPLPGFPAHRDYVLVPADAAGVLSWLQAVAPDGPRLLTARAEAWFPDYAPALPSATRTELGLTGSVVPHLHCVLTVPDGDVTAATANLRAPLVVNPVTARARQVLLSDAAHPVRQPVRR